MGELQNTKKHIITVLCAIRRARKSEKAYNYSVFQLGELKSATKITIAVLSAIGRAEKCKKANNYIAFCNSEGSKMQKSI